MTERITLLRIPKYKYYFVLTDLLILSLSFFITVYVNSIGTGLNDLGVSRIGLILVFLAMLLSFSLISGSFDIYKLNVILARKEHAAAVSKVLLYVTIITAAASLFFFSFHSIKPVVAFTFVLVSFLMFYLIRIELFSSFYLKMGNKRNVLMIGEPDIYEQITNTIKKEKIPGINIKQFCQLENFSSDGYELEKLVSNNNIDEILIGSNHCGYEELISLIGVCRAQNTSVKVISEKFRIIPDRLSVERLHDIPVIDFTRKYSDNYLKYFKRINDVVISSISLIILSPLLLLIAVMIKLTSKGPVLFTQKRIGLGGKEFDFYKFRSMYSEPGEDEARKQMMLAYMKNNRAQKIIDDRRVTSIGKVIRKTSLDELPQLINVLKGEMSLVGPRPCLPYEFDNYEPWQKKRADIIPGCTGIWQVSGRSSVTFTDSILLDLFYVNNMSPAMDLKLIFKTIPVMALSKGGK